MPRWRVTGPSLINAIADQAGVPATALYAAGLEIYQAAGWVEAETKGEAIRIAHELFPSVPVADLNVEREDA